MKTKTLKRTGRMIPWAFIGFFILATVSPTTAAELPGADPLLKLVEEAKKEGSLVIYHSPTVPDIKRILDRFLQKYPFIKGEQYRASSVSLVNRVLTEARAKVSKWDVLINNTFFLQQLVKKEILQKYLSAERSAFGPGFRDDEGFWTGLFLNAAVLAYNSRMVSAKDVPRSFMDLTDPKWRGKICMEAEPYQMLAGLEKEWGKEKAWDFLRKLAAQKVVLRQGRSLLTQLCAAGEFPLAFPVYNYDVERNKRAGAPLDWVGLPPVVLSQEGIGLGQAPLHPNAGKLFIEFALSKEGQSAVREFGRIPARLEIKPDPPKLTEGIKLIPSDPNLGNEVERLLKEFNALFRK